MRQNVALCGNGLTGEPVISQNGLTGEPVNSQNDVHRTKRGKGGKMVDTR